MHIFSNLTGGAPCWSLPHSWPPPPHILSRQRYYGATSAAMQTGESLPLSSTAMHKTSEASGAEAVSRESQWQPFLGY